MKLIVDNIIFSLQKSGGISVLWYEIIKRLLTYNNDGCYFIEYLNSTKNIFRRLLTIPENSSLNRNNSLLKFKRYINPAINEDEMFIFHSSYYRTCANKFAINITTVYDFNYENYKRGPIKWIHSKQKFNAIKKSDKIVCISEITKKDLLRYIPDIDQSKISVIYLGVSEEIYTLPNKKIGDYVLFVGRRERYKNFDLLVKTLKSMELKLYIVGGGKLLKREYKYLTETIGDKRFKHLGSITNGELNTYYNNAFCLVYPSECEGFGIPIIEAQKASCPVVAFNGSSIAEIASNGSALLYDTHTVEDIACKINLLYDTKLRKSIVESGKINSERFSWDKTFDAYKKIYKECGLR